MKYLFLEAASALFMAAVIRNSEDKQELAPTANFTWKFLESSLCLVIRWILIDDGIRLDCS